MSPSKSVAQGSPVKSVMSKQSRSPTKRSPKKPSPKKANKENDLPLQMSTMDQSDMQKSRRGRNARASSRGNSKSFGNVTQRKQENPEQTLSQIQ